MDDVIGNLDDATARCILDCIARVPLHSGAAEVPWTLDLGQALAGFFELSPPREPASDGELARSALQLAAEDPATREAIRIMAANPPETGTRYDPGRTTALTAAVPIVLQTHLRFERDKEGKSTLKIEKKPTTEALLKPLVQKLLAYLPPGKQIPWRPSLGAKPARPRFIFDGRLTAVRDLDLSLGAGGRTERYLANSRACRGGNESNEGGWVYTEC